MTGSVSSHTKCSCPFQGRTAHTPNLAAFGKDVVAGKPVLRVWAKPSLGRLRQSYACMHCPWWHHGCYSKHPTPPHPRAGPGPVSPLPSPSGADFRGQVSLRLWPVLPMQCPTSLSNASRPCRLSGRQHPYPHPHPHSPRPSRPRSLHFELVWTWSKPTNVWLSIGQCPLLAPS